MLAWHHAYGADDAAELTALRAKVAEMEAAIAVKGGTVHAPTQDAYDAVCAALNKHRARAEAAEARAVAAEAARDAAWGEARKVKPLEWTGSDGVGSGAFYTVWANTPDEWLVNTQNHVLGGVLHGRYCQSYKTKEAAKAAAQAHYDARILAALQPPPLAALDGEGE